MVELCLTRARVELGVGDLGIGDLGIVGEERDNVFCAGEWASVEDAERVKKVYGL